MIVEKLSALNEKVILVHSLASFIVLIHVSEFCYSRESEFLYHESEVLKRSALIVRRFLGLKIENRLNIS